MDGVQAAALGELPFLERSIAGLIPVKFRLKGLPAHLKSTVNGADAAKAFSDAAAVLDGQLYVCGGAGLPGLERSVFRFSPQTRRWQQAERMIEPRQYPSATVPGDRLHVCGADVRAPA